jgi:hypothetical protein
MLQLYRSSKQALIHNDLHAGEGQHGCSRCSAHLCWVLPLV